MALNESENQSDLKDSQSTAFIIDDKNYADDQELCGRALDWLKKVSTEVVTHRGTLDMRYMQFYNIYRCNFDIRFYEGVSQVYIPELRKHVEQYVAKLKKALFPTEDLLDAEPTVPEMADESEVVDSLMTWQITKKIKLEHKLDRWLRQLIMYGWAPAKCVWEHEDKEIFGMEREQIPVYEMKLDPISGQRIKTPTGKMKTRLVQKKKTIVTKNNPTFVPIDVFAWYMYPVTCNDISEAFGTLEVSHQDEWYLKERGRKGDYLNTDRISKELSAETGESPSGLWSWAREQRLASDGLSTIALKKDIPDYTVVEYWGKFNWAKSSEDPDYRDTVITTVNNKLVLQIRVNPFYDQEIPYVMARMHDLQNESYPSGLFEPLASLQYYLNDTANQTFDSLLYTLNPIVKYNPNQIANINSIAFAPGAMWALNDMAAVEFERPVDVSPAGFNAVGQVKNIMEEYPGMQNIPLLGRKAATHIQAIEEQYSLPIISLASKIEAGALDPWLKMAYRRNQQFLSDDEVFLVTGKRGVKYWQRVGPEMLVGDYNFYWKGSSQSTQIHVKTQQKMQFLQIALPCQQLLAAEGVKLGVSRILRSIWTEGLGFDGGDLVLENVISDQGIDPVIEDHLMNLGKYIHVSELDDHKAHLQQHSQDIQQMNPYSQKLAQRHMQEHQLTMQQAQMAGQPGPQMQQPGNDQGGGQGGTSQVGELLRNEYTGLRAENLSNKMAEE